MGMKGDRRDAHAITIRHTRDKEREGMLSVEKQKITTRRIRKKGGKLSLCCFVCLLCPCTL